MHAKSQLLNFVMFSDSFEKTRVQFSARRSSKNFAKNVSFLLNNDRAGQQIVEIEPD